MSKPKPIHAIHRPLRETPDETEPSFSYEQESFLAQAGDDFEDEFRPRFSLNNRRGSNGGNNSSSNLQQQAQQQQQPQPLASSLGSGPSGSFWRTADGAAPAATANGSGAAAAVQIAPPPAASNDRQKSGGLLSAALQLHSQSGSSQEAGSSWSADTEQITNSGGYRKSNSTLSEKSNSSGNRDKKKDVSKQRQEARRLKMDFQLEEVDIGHQVEEVVMDLDAGFKSVSAEHPPLVDSHSHGSTTTDSSGGGGSHRFSRGSSSQQRSGGGLFVGKSSSLIFPTGVEPPADAQGETSNLKKHKINIILDQCENIRFPFKKKLMLNNLNLSAADIPVKDLYGTSLGNSLHKLSLAGNQLSSIPVKLVTCLPVLKDLDLSQCDLHGLPEKWDLPQLKRLNLSHNRLTEFPEETMLEGLPELQQLNLYGNKVSLIVIPTNPKLLSKLELLNLGYNDLAFIPEELDTLKSLKTLKMMNNFVEKIPMRVCDMKQLATIDVSSNPVIQPPIETCERGICSMRRYYECLRVEEQSKQKALERLQNKAAHHQHRKSSAKKAVMEKMKGLTKPMFTLQTSLGRKHSEDSSSRTSNDQSSLASLASSKEIQSISHAPKYGFSPASRGHPFLGGRSSGTSGEQPSPKADVKMPPQDRSVPATTTRSDSGGKQTTEEVPNSVSVEDVVSVDESNGTRSISAMSETSYSEYLPPADQVSVNDTLKVIFVGMAMAGKTSMIKRLIEGEGAKIPTRDERTIGVDIYEWDPKKDHRFEHIDSRIELQDKELEETCGDVDVKFSVWDFAGQHVYHATHELFFSQRALFVLVWDMGATNPSTIKQRNVADDSDQGAFKLSYDSSDEEEDKDDDFVFEEEARRADRALDRDIDEKVQFWVDCIQSSAPGAAILPVASFDDKFSDNNFEEAKRRCNIMKQRLLKHEERRLRGIKARLKEYEDKNRANDQGALRLRKLLSPYARPKLIFGDTLEDSVVRVSGLEYTGFAPLTERIINIATGRDKGKQKYPIFRGHVGARIPRMRLEVRDTVRAMRERFKVVEWGYFINQLRDKGLHSVEDISDALHFLTNIGELSYFGGVLPDRDTVALVSDDQSGTGRTSAKSSVDDDDDNSVTSDGEEYADNANLSIDNTSITAPVTDEESSTLNGDSFSSGLSQFVFLNPRWLVAAVACILRHDLDREIQETRRSLQNSSRSSLSRAESFYEANLNCPVITSDDACMLWDAKRFTKKAAERAQEHRKDLPMKPFEFLQLLLTKFGVFVPIDLGIERAFLGGREYSQRNLNVDEDTTPTEITIGGHQSNYYFLPSLLGPGEPAEAWGYKSTDSWKVTLCHSILFPDGVPPGLMERITASVLSNIYTITNRRDTPLMEGLDSDQMATYEGKITLKEILCWRTAFFVKLGMQSISPNGESRESVVEVFCGLVDRDSHLCVGSDYLGVGMRRLITSAKGQEGDGGRKIWKGGYLLVCKAVHRVMEEYGGLEYEKQGFCPVCLSFKKPVEQASSWDFTVIRSAVKNSELTMRCGHGHEVDTRLIAGPVDSLQQAQKPNVNKAAVHEASTSSPSIPFKDLVSSIVVVALWDAKSQKVVRVGSGFIADRKRGLIVTASHTLMNIYGEKTSPFGENYYGLRQGKVLIGVIPQKQGERAGNEAVFRYFARIVAKDPSIEKGECHIDACILRITTRLENDVGGQGEGCGEQPEKLLLNNQHALKQEKLQALSITEKCEIEEQVRIMGYNQGGEGLLVPGQNLNRFIDFTRGYVCKIFTGGKDTEGYLRHRFKPLSEIVVSCETIGGHSGGPCVNSQGEVIGILSRADPAQGNRCYLVPTAEWKPLLKQAKYTLQ